MNWFKVNKNASNALFGAAAVVSYEKKIKNRWDEACANLSHYGG